MEAIKGDARSLDYGSDYLGLIGCAESCVLFASGFLVLCTNNERGL